MSAPAPAPPAGGGEAPSPPGRRVRAALDLTDRGTLRAVSRRAGLSPQRRLGQHLLVDRAVLDDIIAALEPLGGAEVLEVGTGAGTLTAELARCARRVVSVEIDPAALRAARLTLRGLGNVEIVEADVLRCDPQGLGLEGAWLAAGNLPYQLTGAVLGHLFEAARPPARGVFLVQREVARRLAAPAGDWSLATVALRSLAEVERVRDVAPDSFHPPPAVHSSIIRMRPAVTMGEPERARVIRMARSAFQLRRKTLRHGITRAVGGDPDRAAAVLAAAAIDPTRRPGTLTLAEWRALAREGAADG